MGVLNEYKVADVHAISKNASQTNKMKTKMRRCWFDFPTRSVNKRNKTKDNVSSNNDTNSENGLNSTHRRICSPFLTVDCNNFIHTQESLIDCVMSNSRRHCGNNTPNSCLQNDEKVLEEIQLSDDSELMLSLDYEPFIELLTNEQSPFYQMFKRSLSSSTLIN